MAKKIIISLAVIILLLCCSVCFAAENNLNVNLGEEITDSLNKTGDSAKNVVNDAMNTVDGNDKNDNNDKTSKNNNLLTNSTGYNAVRTSIDDATTGTMSTTTWIWIILAIVAIVVVAMIWYYAVQNNDRD